MKTTFTLLLFCAIIGLGTCLPPLCVLECMKQWLTCEIQCRNDKSDLEGKYLKECSKDCAIARRSCLNPCTIFADIKRAVQNAEEKVKKIDLKTNKSHKVAVEAIKEEIRKHGKRTSKLEIAKPNTSPEVTIQDSEKVSSEKASKTAVDSKSSLAIEIPKSKKQTQSGKLRIVISTSSEVKPIPETPTVNSRTVPKLEIATRPTIIKKITISRTKKTQSKTNNEIAKKAKTQPLV